MELAEAEEAEQEALEVLGLAWAQEEAGVPVLELVAAEVALAWEQEAAKADSVEALAALEEHAEQKRCLVLWAA
ncbi:MAG: hypothetical protein HY458_02390 [Parcubacteria group bacterium]|nr:hypothetical protein [Parcubacteria group bacterium]